MNNPPKHVKAMVSSEGFIHLEVCGLRIDIGKDEDVKACHLRKVMHYLSLYALEGIDQHESLYETLLFRCAAAAKRGEPMISLFIEILEECREYAHELGIKERINEMYNHEIMAQIAEVNEREKAKSKKRPGLINDANRDAYRKSFTSKLELVR